MTTMQERYRELRGSGLDHDAAMRQLIEERDDPGKVGRQWATAADLRDALELIAAGTDNPRDGPAGVRRPVLNPRSTR